MTVGSLKVGDVFVTPLTRRLGLVLGKAFVSGVAVRFPADGDAELHPCCLVEVGR